MSKADKTKELIIERTAEIFNTKGYIGTSLNDMTHITGLSKGSIYGNFKNKDEVAIEAFKYNLQIMNQLFSTEIAKKQAYREKLLVYSDVLSNFSEISLPRGGCPILNTAIESDDTHPKLKYYAKKAFIAWKDAIVNMLHKGIEAGEFKATINTEQVSITILATLEGAIMIQKLTDNQEYIKLAMKSLQEFINRL